MGTNHVLNQCYWILLFTPLGRWGGPKPHIHTVVKKYEYFTRRVGNVFKFVTDDFVREQKHRASTKILKLLLNYFLSLSCGREIKVPLFWRRDIIVQDNYPISCRTYTTRKTTHRRTYFDGNNSVAIEPTQWNIFALV